jgi:peptidoglycan hydrolase CwlO-like protein
MCNYDADFMERIDEKIKKIYNDFVKIKEELQKQKEKNKELETKLNNLKKERK